jgi:ankyrin repeat protein
MVLLLIVLIGVSVWLVAFPPNNQDDLNHALIAAIRANDPPTVLRLLRQGADVHAGDPNPLNWSPSRRSLVHLYKRLGLFPKDMVFKEPTALQVAVSGQYDMMKAHPVNLVIIKMLLDRGANVNERDLNRRTPLLTAARSGNPESIHLLLDKGADINAHDRYGATPLRIATGYNYPVIAKLLLDRGAQANLKDDRGHTALWSAQHNHYTSLISLLKQYGAK